MDKQKLYEHWIEKKQQPKISQSFSDQIMNQIIEYENTSRWFDMQKLIEIISANAIIKNGLVATGAIIGLARVTYMIFIMLA